MGMKIQRLKEMEQFIQAKEFVTLDELCERFGVSKNTVRADVNELAQRGMLEKQYGGVNAISFDKKMKTFIERQEKEHSSKSSIGRSAAELLEPNDVIFVDSGTTTACMFNQDVEFPEGLTVITNNLVVINQYERYSNVNFFILSGMLNTKTRSFLGMESIDQLKRYNINKAFIAASGISPAGGMTNSTTFEAKLKETAIQVSQYSILLADSSKINHPTVINFATMDEIDIWICDKQGRAPAKKICDTHNVRLMIAE